MSQVPDRGGRVWELEPPPPEMPSFMKRDSAGQGQRPQSESTAMGVGVWGFGCVGVCGCGCPV